MDRKLITDADGRQLLRIVNRRVHARVPRRFLHLVKFHFLLIESQLDLRHPLQLSRLITVVRSLVLDAPARGTNRRIELVDPRLQNRHLIFLRQDLSLPLVSRALFRQALLRRAMVSRGAAHTRS